jgi:hypothetical protein
MQLYTISSITVPAASYAGFSAKVTATGRLSLKKPIILRGFTFGENV